MNKGVCRSKNKIYARAYYNIIKAFEGKRLLSTFGFELPKSTYNQAKIITQVQKPSVLTYQAKEHDWVNEETGSMLTRYEPTNKLKQVFLRIDKVLY